MFQLIQSNMKNNKTIILGLNGWSERGHDASACLVIGGKIVAFAEEERFNRKRYSFDSMPRISTAYCMNEANINVDDIDYIVYGWDLPLEYSLRGRALLNFKEHIVSSIFPKTQYKYEKIPKIEFLNHHLSHAVSSYRLSGFKDASILVLDGQGENASGTLGYAKNGEIKIINQIPIAFSLGYMMEAACKYLGLKTFEAGKLMGLAGHGKKGHAFGNFVFDKLSYSIKDFPKDRDLLKDSLDEQEKIIDIWLKYFKDNFNIKTEKNSFYVPQTGNINSQLCFNQSQKNFAYSVQLSLEKAVIYLAKSLIDFTGCKDLVIAGGIGLNCTTNGILISQNIVNNLYISPAANDAGVSIGAAIEKAHKINKTNFKRLDHIFLGPKFNNTEIKNVLDKHKISYKKVINIEKIAAESLANGKIVAWFQGRMEGGPRALGNRSILANPKIASMHKIVNEIKSRENWRPLAPSIMEEYREDYFNKGSFSPFMLQNHQVYKNKAKEIPAVVHTDLTSRYQSVTKKTNGRYYRLINEFYKITGTPVVLNTSFNIAGEPIVCTPDQAIRSFYSCAIDCLAIGDYWITKHE